MHTRGGTRGDTMSGDRYPWVRSTLREGGTQGHSGSGSDQRGRAGRQGVDEVEEVPRVCVLAKWYCCPHVTCRLVIGDGDGDGDGTVADM